MRDTKSSLLLIVSLLLLSLSLVLLSIWGYQFFSSSQKEISKPHKKIQLTTTTDTVSTYDSLLKIYTSTINKLDSRIDSVKVSTDSLIGNVDVKLNEINTLKDEINAILKNKSSKETLTTARGKIDELQLKVAQLQNRNFNIEKENKRLKAMLQELDEDKDGSSQHINVAPAHSKSPVSKTTPTQAFVVKDIVVTALQVKDNKELETFKASETEKLSGSFIIKSNIPRKNANIFIAVLHPNGKAGQNSDWEAGTFYTPEGIKIYTNKIPTSFEKGEEKQLYFSVSADNFEKGNYTVLIYFNGLIIGRLVKSLS